MFEKAKESIVTHDHIARTDSSRKHKRFSLQGEFVIPNLLFAYLVLQTK